MIRQAHARRYNGHDDQRILALYGYVNIRNTGSHNTKRRGVLR
jgi:hypothetical protein